VNIELLDRLRRAGGEFLLGPLLGDDPGRLSRELDELVAFGFGLERHPYRGTAYRGPAARLCPDQIEWGWQPRHIGRRIAVWDRVVSTNDLAARAASSVANDGLVVMSESQSAGRGRRGRSWAAPPHSAILMSVLIFPPPPLADPSWLTALGAVAVAKTIADFTGLVPRIKWPNDVRIGGLKVAGILVERGARPGVVVGIGLNVNLDEMDFPAELSGVATSLSHLIGSKVDRSELARALINRLDDLYCEGLDLGLEPLGQPWREMSEHLGFQVEVVHRDGAHRGLLVDVALGHSLTFELEDGRVLDVAEGSISSLRSLEPRPPGL
jgi:BirA family biotin operon repressor/biotin-[acetyl-CoA-carboxylase] ligase